jgi:two-component system response regulator ChvI
LPQEIITKDQTMAAAIALVDNNQNILTSVSMALKSEGFCLKTYKNQEDALIGITTTIPDLVIIDIKMPRLDRIAVLTKFRQTSSLPIIFFTSKDEEVDEVVGLGLRIDDYITKPFSQRLLSTRTRALLQREEHIKNIRETDPKATMVRGKLSMDKSKRL